MARRKPYPRRPDKPVRIGTVLWNLQNVATHVQAGFDPMPDVLVRTHYFRYWEFLKRHGYLLKETPTNIQDWDGELFSTDLTLEGYRFAQYSHDRWIGRVLKFRDQPGDLRYLDKWHKKFMALPKGTFTEYDA